MMKGCLAAAIGVLFLVELTLCTALEKNSIVTDASMTKLSGEPAVGGLLCEECYRFTSVAIQYLVELVLNAGIMGSCASLCGALANKTSSQILGFACQTVCSIVGIKDFIEALEKADLDPIYYCELLHECEVKDDGDCKIMSLDIEPKSAPRGSEFDVNVIFATENGTGPGQFEFNIDTVDGEPANGMLFHDSIQPGTYKMNFKLDTNKNDAQSPEEWKKGNYTLHFAVCNGECGSKHPHSQIYDQAEAGFNLTKKEDFL